MSRFCPLPVVTGEPSQGSRRVSGFLSRLPFAAAGACTPLVSTDPNPSRKVDQDYSAHLRSPLPADTSLAPLRCPLQ